MDIRNWWGSYNDTQMYNPTEPNNITSTLYLVEEIVNCLTHLKDDT